MRISHYFEWEEAVTGGISQSVKNQRKILDEKEVEYTTKPDLEADILHLNNVGPKSLYYARKAKKKGVPVIFHTHQTSEDFKNSFVFSNILARPLRPYLKYIYSLADMLICPSEFNKNTMENYAEVEKTVISNGFDPEKLKGFEELRQEYLDRYDLEPPVVFNVGHVIKRKGLETFVETAEKMPELDFVWFGYLNPMGGELDRFLKSHSTKKLVENSPENCTFTGYINDIRGAYAAGDIFFFPTKNENEGIAMLEAMGCGKPLVLRDIETFGWLEDGKHCIKSEEEFTEPLEMMEDKDFREKIGKNAKKKSSEFEIEKVGDKLIETYRELI